MRNLLPIMLNALKIYINIDCEYKNIKVNASIIFIEKIKTNFRNNMNFIFYILKKFYNLLSRIFTKLTILLFSVVVYGVISEYILEHNAPGSGIKTLFDSLWFVMQTITTVGYGDTPVVTFWGRVNAMFLMVIGIGTLGVFAASITSFMVSSAISKRSGEVNYRMKTHVIVCNWNENAHELIKDIERKKEDVVLLANLNSTPDKEINFTKGSCLNIEDLNKVNVNKAKIVIILSEAVNDRFATAIDAENILGVMNVKKANPNAHIIVELLKQESIENAKLAGADEFMVKGTLSVKILSKGALNPGTIEILETIVTGRKGEEIFEEMIPTWYYGKRYEKLAFYLFKNGAIPLAIRNNDNLNINPKVDTVMSGGFVIYISNKKITIKKE